MEENQGQEKERKHLLQNICENKARLFEIWHTRENCSNGQSSVNKSVLNTFSLQYAEAMGLSHPILPPPSLLGKSYLDLRHDQNMAWAQDRLDKGVSLARASLQPSAKNKHALARKAEACYKEGLEMIPNHVGILTAYGALCANDGRLSLAKKMLEKAQCDIKSNLSSNKDANAPDKASNDAMTYLSIVERKIKDLKRTDKKGSNAQVTLSNKGEKLLNDALAERAFLTGNDPKDCSVISTKYKLLSSSSSESSISSNESRRRRKRSKSRHKKRKKKTRSKSSHRDESRSSHRRKQRRNGDDDSDEYSSNSDHYKSRKRQSRGERKRKRKRR